MIDSDQLAVLIDNTEWLYYQSEHINVDLDQLVADDEYDHDAALEAFRGLVEAATVAYEEMLPGERASENAKTDAMREYRDRFEAERGMG